MPLTVVNTLSGAFPAGVSEWVIDLQALGAQPGDFLQAVLAVQHTLRALPSPFASSQLLAGPGGSAYAREFRCPIYTGFRNNPSILFDSVGAGGVYAMVLWRASGYQLEQAAFLSGFTNSATELYLPNLGISPRKSYMTYGFASDAGDWVEDGFFAVDATVGEDVGAGRGVAVYSRGQLTDLSVLPPSTVFWSRAAASRAACFVTYLREAPLNPYVAKPWLGRVWRRVQDLGRVKTYDPPAATRELLGLDFLDWASIDVDFETVLGSKPTTARFEAYLNPPETQTYTFYVTHSQGLTVWLDGEEVYRAAGAASGSFTRNLTKHHLTYAVLEHSSDNAATEELEFEWEYFSDNAGGLLREFVPGYDFFCLNQGQNLPN